MDTSEQYIKMRFKAIPDLGRGKSTIAPEIMDRTFVDGAGNWHFVYKENRKLATICQLERQDELQEMALREGETLESLFTRFRDEYSLIDDDGTFAVWLKGFTSFEQLWLAFYMKQKYNKVWDNGEWKEG